MPAHGCFLKNLVDDSNDLTKLKQQANVAITAIWLASVLTIYLLAKTRLYIVP